MTSPLGEVTAKIGQLPQTQDSLDAQIRELHAIANKLGLYDAADGLLHVISHGHVIAPPSHGGGANPENVLPSSPQKHPGDEYRITHRYRRPNSESGAPYGRVIETRYAANLDEVRDMTHRWLNALAAGQSARNQAKGLPKEGLTLDLQDQTQIVVSRMEDTHGDS